MTNLKVYDFVKDVFTFDVTIVNLSVFLLSFIFYFLFKSGEILHEFFIVEPRFDLLVPDENRIVVNLSRIWQFASQSWWSVLLDLSDPPLVVLPLFSSFFSGGRELMSRSVK